MSFADLIDACRANNATRLAELMETELLAASQAGVAGARADASPSSSLLTTAGLKAYCVRKAENGDHDDFNDIQWPMEDEELLLQSTKKNKERSDGDHKQKGGSEETDDGEHNDAGDDVKWGVGVNGNGEVFVSIGDAVAKTQDDPLAHPITFLLAEAVREGSVEAIEYLVRTFTGSSSPSRKNAPASSSADAPASSSASAPPVDLECDVWAMLIDTVKYRYVRRRTAFEAMALRCVPDTEYERAVRIQQKAFYGNTAEEEAAFALEAARQVAPPRFSFRPVSHLVAALKALNCTNIISSIAPDLAVFNDTGKAPSTLAREQKEAEEKEKAATAAAGESAATDTPPPPQEQQQEEGGNTKSAKAAQPNTKKKSKKEPIKKLQANEKQWTEADVRAMDEDTYKLYLIMRCFLTFHVRGAMLKCSLPLLEYLFEGLGIDVTTSRAYSKTFSSLISTFISGSALTGHEKEEEITAAIAGQVGDGDVLQLRNQTEASNNDSNTNDAVPPVRALPSSSSAAANAGGGNFIPLAREESASLMGGREASSASMFPREFSIVSYSDFNSNVVDVRATSGEPAAVTVDGASSQPTASSDAVATVVDEPPRRRPHMLDGYRPISSPAVDRALAVLRYVLSQSRPYVKDWDPKRFGEGSILERALRGCCTLSTIRCLAEEFGFDVVSPIKAFGDFSPIIFAMMKRPSPSRQQEQLAIIDYLINVQKCDEHHQGAGGQSPFLYAASVGRVDVLKYLMYERGHSTDSGTTVHGWTPLHRACSSPNPKAAALLIREGAMLDHQTNKFANAFTIGGADNEGETPLHTAVKENSIGAVQLLLDAGCDTSLRDAEGNTPLECVPPRPPRKRNAALDVFEVDKEDEYAEMRELLRKEVSGEEDHEDDELVAVQKEERLAIERRCQAIFDEEFLFN